MLVFVHVSGVFDAFIAIFSTTSQVAEFALAN
jgi:hypothetical protein